MHYALVSTGAPCTYYILLKNRTLWHRKRYLNGLLCRMAWHGMSASTSTFRCITILRQFTYRKIILSLLHFICLFAPLLFCASGAAAAVVGVPTTMWIVFTCCFFLYLFSFLFFLSRLSQVLYSIEMPLENRTIQFLFPVCVFSICVVVVVVVVDIALHWLCEIGGKWTVILSIDSSRVQNWILSPNWRCCS